MSYLDQILQDAKALTQQQRGGLSNEQFDTIYGHLMTNRTQPNLGMSQFAGMPQGGIGTDVQRRTPIQQTQVPMTWGTGVNTAALGKNSGVISDPTFGLYDRYKASQRHDTNLFSEQTGMLAEQDRGMYDDEEAKKGLFSMDWFK
jgi:hypothetical protein